MIEVIKHGDRRWVRECEKCGCVFGVCKTDTIYDKDKKINVATCPECGRTVEVENESL